MEFKFLFCFALKHTQSEQLMGVGEIITFVNTQITFSHLNHKSQPFVWSYNCTFSNCDFDCDLVI